MNKTIRFCLALAAVAALLMASAAVAGANPTQSGACSTCHGTGGVTVIATQLSNNGATATYSVLVSGGSGLKGWAVKDGATNVAHASGASGQFTVAVGKSYTVWGVDNATGSGTKVVSPTAPTPPSPNPTGTPEPTGTPNPTPTPTPEPTTTPTPPANPSAVCLGCHKQHGNGLTCIGCHTASPHEEGEGPNFAPTRCAVSIHVTRNGKAIKGAWVSVYYGSGKRLKARTDATGLATISNVPTGTRTVKITYGGKLVKRASVKLSTATRSLNYRI